MKTHFTSLTPLLASNGAQRRPGGGEAGSAIVLTLVIAGVIALTVAVYLSWANTQNTMAARSQCWNAALPVTEAGLEEALTQLHYTGVSNLSSNGWTAGTNGWYFKQNYVDGRGYYVVNIRSIQLPVIVSTGYVPAPLSLANYVKRRVRVTTTGGAPIAAAVVSKGAISLSGNNVTIDSFNSTDPTASTNGKWDPLKARDKGNVITMAHDGLTSNGKPLYALDIGDADIKGHVSVIPGATVNLTSGGSVGDLSWVNAGTQGIEAGWSATDANVGIDDVKPPFSGGYSTPVLTSGNKVPYNYVLDQSVNYQLSKLSGRVLVTGNATLWVTDDVSIGSGDFIEIAAGASLKLYVSAPSASIAGQGVINDGGSANGFQYFGLPTNTSIDYKGNSAFYGIIYAPEAALKLGGGGTTDMDYTGSMTVASLAMNGHYHIHWDEGVQNLLASAIIVSTWNEVDPNGPIQ